MTPANLLRTLLLASVATLVFEGRCTAATATPEPGTERVNTDRQPAWGPSGYPLAEYYYIPAPDIYYDVERALFYSSHDSRWVASASLPESAEGTNLYACYKVVMNGREPWRNHHNHTFVYERYRTRQFTQPTIGRDTSATGRRAAKGRHNPRRQR